MYRSRISRYAGLGRGETYLGTTYKAGTSASCLKATGYASSQCPQADTQPRTENLGIMTESKQPWLASPVSGAPSRVRPRSPRAQTKSCPSATYNMNNGAHTPRNPMISRTARGWQPKFGSQLPETAISSRPSGHRQCARLAVL